MKLDTFLDEKHSYQFLEHDSTDKSKDHATSSDKTTTRVGEDVNHVIDV